jgi:ppGpp synthetase/RelA/SpoT-type nucleotidyltranferase
VQEGLVRLFHEKERLDPRFVPITARPLKTREAIIAKLIREKARLNRIHDIAGARIVVSSRVIQALVLRVIMERLPELKPQVAKDSTEHGDAQGYRAIHVVVTTSAPGIGERHTEIQIRTEMENEWAQLVERLDAVLGLDLKHGQGPAEYQEWLREASAVIGAVDRGEATTIQEIPPFPGITP